MQILSLLGMYFDTAVVKVKTFYFYSDWLWPYCDDLAPFLKDLSQWENISEHCKPIPCNDYRDLPVY